MRTWIREPLAILDREAAGGLVIEGERIVERVPIGARPSAPVDAEFDARAHVVLPGLVNTHHHFYQTLTRACPPALDKPLFPWLEALYPVWAGLRPEHLAVAARVALVELLRSGCTTVADHHYLFPAGLDEAIDIEVDAVRALGMRAVLTRGSMSLSQEDGGLPPRSVVQREDAILTDSERLLARYHEAGEGAMLQIALAPCSPFSVSGELMRESAALARRHGARLHTHLAETEDETDYCLAHFGHRPVDYLETLGWLADDVWVAHGIHFDDAEIARLGAAGVGVTHCPSSNMVLASGRCRVLALESAGTPVSLGVDGSASNDASNLMIETRQAFLLQRLHEGAARVGHRDALRWATEGGARCLGRPDLGRLTPGAQADLALFRLDELGFAGAGDPLAALVLCGAHAADRVMIAGQWRLIDGEVPGLDVEALVAAQREASAALLTAAGVIA
ncbi:8-oxoguanine deaminase [Acidihalobacter yilgarnensis]|uniref:8-oxoguanine deaminase n=1 Tax=Acidihalobacter yilgarnensis TaxID=2819280 RepID=A0A1D8IKF3_9GAMM|nr:8-oxoguanine deaminase [Acidihalobacter yilgarnensis]AOU96942.1 8-oxoguanine deaminase [Acidihalobacter yilgarnensis]